MIITILHKTPIKHQLVSFQLLQFKSQSLNIHFCSLFFCYFPFTLPTNHIYTFCIFVHHHFCINLLIFIFLSRVILTFLLNRFSLILFYCGKSIKTNFPFYTSIPLSLNCNASHISFLVMRCFPRPW